MTVRFNARIDDKELQRALNAAARRFSAEDERNPITRSLDAAVRPLESAIRSATPVNTGRTQRRIRKEIRTSRDRKTTYAAVGFRFPSLKRANYGRYLSLLQFEFGAKSGRNKGKRGAKKILRGTFDSNRSAMINRFNRSFRRSWEMVFRR